MNGLTGREEIFQKEEQVKFLICHDQKIWLRKDKQRIDQFVKRKKQFRKSKDKIRFFSEREEYFCQNNAKKIQ